jgi:hypothetical protein
MSRLRRKQPFDARGLKSLSQKSWQLDQRQPKDRFELDTGHLARAAGAKLPLSGHPSTLEIAIRSCAAVRGWGATRFGSPREMTHAAGTRA